MISINKKLSIIIVNYKSAFFLQKCVDSIYEKIGPDILLEIIAVNNDKEEALEPIFGNYPGIKIINNPENVGFGAGHNAGAKISQGEILFFLNPDAEVASSRTEEILSLFEKDEKIGIVGSRLCSEEGEIQEWSAGYEANVVDLIRNNLGWPKSQEIWRCEKPIEAEWVAATALFIRKELFEEIGGFDENFFMYFEDMDLCKRAREKGKKVLYHPRFIVKHLGGKSYQEKKMQKKDYYKSQEYYFKKHRNFFEWLAVKVLGKLFY